LEEKKLLFYLWEKLAPEVQRESRGTATENANKVVLECLDGFFSHVASIFTGIVGCWHVETGVKTTDMCLSD
jgi:hypothetical protein